MPLSDREKALLQEMEAALLTEDPRLVSVLTGRANGPQKNRIALGLSLVLLGVATLFGGLISNTTLVGVLGFLISLVGLIFAISSFGATATSPRKRARKGLGLNQKMEQRWDRRNNEP